MTVESFTLDPGEASFARYVWQCGVVKQLGLNTISSPMSTADEARAKNHLNKMDKDKVIKLFIETWKHVSAAQSQVKSLVHSEREISGKLVESQKETIRLQLIARKDEELQKVRSVVEDSVKETVQQEIKLYSQAVGSSHVLGQPDISSETIQKAIRTVANEDSRSSNVMIFGLPEKVSEDLSSAHVGQVFSEISENPKFEATRLGTRKDNSIRPMKVQLRTGEIAGQLLKKVSALRKTEHFKNLYVCPDRTVEQRAQFRKLLAHLKTKIEEEPRRVHFIRDGSVVSKERNIGGGI